MVPYREASALMNSVVQLYEQCNARCCSLTDVVAIYGGREAALPSWGEGVGRKRQIHTGKGVNVTCVFSNAKELIGITSKYQGITKVCV